MARTRNKTKARKKPSGELALKGTPRRKPSGKMRDRPVDARRVKPTPEQEARRKILLKGAPGSPDDPLGVAKAHGHLSERHCEALHRYRNKVQMFRMASGAPREAPDILSTLEPSRGEGLTSEEALKHIQDSYSAAEDVLRQCRRKENEALQILVATWGCTITRRTCEVLEYPAELLAVHFGIV
ncbi:hypothetical protein [Henriciella sp.]|uniref:hypothetical protein n=1 Tax=Henriciella sp. TaxID=1968823 RepID=UPI002615AE2E|nr:hypothetical protein [Henriciella sp.]